MPRAMAAATLFLAFVALLAPGAEAQLQVYTDNFTGFVSGLELISNAQCKQVRTARLNRRGKRGPGRSRGFRAFRVNGRMRHSSRETPPPWPSVSEEEPACRVLRAHAEDPRHTKKKIGTDRGSVPRCFRK